MRTDANILIVDDQPRLLELLSLTLKTAGYQVLTASNGFDALAVLRSQPVDLILADIAMPGMNGYQLYQRIAEHPQWVAIPFLFLTARALDSDIRYGKQLGVDDYLTKPIEPEDLLATVSGKLRRARKLAEVSLQSPSSTEANPDVLVRGRLKIDTAQRRVCLNGTEVELSAREFKLLEHLARQVNRVIPLQELIKHTHGLDTDYGDASALARPLVRSVRRKLGYPAGEMGCIESVRGVGYQLVSLKLES